MSQVLSVPPGRRELTKVQNRQAILEAARSVFGELGYDAVTVRDIIRRTGLAAGTFYNYFRSKDEVAAALSDDGTRRFAPILKAQREQASDWADFVRRALGAYYTFLADEQSNWLARRPIDESHPRVHGVTPEGLAVFEEVRASIVEEAARGGAQGGDPYMLAAACIGIARYVGEQMLVRRPVDTQAATDFAVTMILTGVTGLRRSTN
jgi:AcrR family transcriptional regulator